MSYSTAYYVVAVICIFVPAICTIYLAVTDSFDDERSKLKIQKMTGSFLPVALSYNERVTCLRYAWKEIRDIEKAEGL